MVKIFLFLCTFVLNTASLHASGNIDSLAQFVSPTLTVRGKVAKPLELTRAQLLNFRLNTVRSVPVVSYSGERKETIAAARGVLLKDILDSAGIVFEEKRDFNRLVIVATATDGFKTLFSWHELYNSTAGNHILVIIEKDGKPLGNREGQFLLLSTHDLKTGPRHVRWLRTIEVVKL